MELGYNIISFLFKGKAEERRLFFGFSILLWRTPRLSCSGARNEANWQLFSLH